MHDVAVDVRQAIITASVAVGETSMVDAQHVQDRRMEVMDVDSVLSDGRTDFVRAAVADARFDSGTGHPR